MTSILKKNTPSPPSDLTDLTQTACECNLCNERLSNEIINKSSSSLVESVYEDNAETDLEDLIFGLVMLIVEGRDVSRSEIYQDHANFIIENLLVKAVSLNQIAMAGDSKFVVPRARRISQHICFNQSNIKCRIASRLKEKIEKCIQDHTRIAEGEEIDQTESQEPHSTPSFLQQPKLTADISFSDSDAKTSNQNSKLYSEFTHIVQAKLNLKSSSVALISRPPQFNTCTNITVNVYLLPSCCFNEFYAKTGDHLLDTASIINNGVLKKFELLECWTISMVKSNVNQQRNEPVNRVKLLTLNELFQAIRSYLHFSQISSWINQSNGKQLKNIAFSFNYSSVKHSPLVQQQSNYPQETIDNKTFDFQKFPTLNLLLANNKFCINNQLSTSQLQPTSTQLQVSLLSRKRTLIYKPPRLVACPVQDHPFAAMTSTTTNQILINNEADHLQTAQNIKNNLFNLPHTINLNDHYLINSPDSTTPPTSFLLTPQTTITNQPIKLSNVALNLYQSQISTPPPDRGSLANITTPTSFPNSKEKILPIPSDNTTSNCCFNSSLISQSPKVLVSNHQLVTDLCSFTQNQLKINTSTNTMNTDDDLASNGNLTTFSSNDFNVNKRKFIHENDSALRGCLNCQHGEELRDDHHTILTPISTHESQQLDNSSDINTYNYTNSENKQTQHPDVNNNNYISSGIDPNALKKPRKFTKFSQCQFSSSNLPLSSSPAPCRKSGSLLFDFDNTLKNPRSIRNALTNSNDTTEEESGNTTEATNKQRKNLKRSTFANYTNSLKSFSMQMGFSNSATTLCSMPIAPSCLLGSFEESLLNARMKPAGVVDGFYAEIGASGSFFPEHVTIPVHAAFYQVCEDIAASPYLGVIDLGSIGKRGYKVPNKGTIQVTLFNPNKTVVKMFVVLYDLSDMPPGHRTFLRQRTMYLPLVSNNSNNSMTPTTSYIKPVKSFNELSGHINNKNKIPGGVNKFDDNDDELKSYLRYLIHLRFATSKSGKMYLHTNIKLIFARNKCEIDPRLAKYDYKTFTEAPKNPRYSPKK